MATSADTVYLDDMNVSGSMSNAQAHMAPAPEAAPAAPVSRANPNASVCSLAYYQSFFDVSTKEAGERVLRALVPIGPPFYTSAAELGQGAQAVPSEAPDAASGSPVVGGAPSADAVPKLAQPDLYGPFWICTTLVFVLAITGNLVDYFSSDAGLVWTYDFEKVSLAATVFYFSVVVFPIGVWFALRRLNAGRTYINIVSLYGYSFAIYIPICPICAIPVPYLNLAGMAVAWLVSTFFLARNVYSYFLSAPVPQDNAEDVESHKKAGLLLVLGIACVHFGIACVAYFYFFSW
jgi:hypothetical protein